MKKITEKQLKSVLTITFLYYNLIESLFSKMYINNHNIENYGIFCGLGLGLGLVG